MSQPHQVLRVATLVVAAALSTAACHRAAPADHEQPSPVAVRCVPAQRSSIDTVEMLRGRVAAPPGGDLPVASQVAGRVLEVLVHEGDHLAAGALVASIDGSTSRDALRQADAAVAQAKSALANADTTLERTRQLVTRGIAAKQELDDAAARADQARASVASAVAAFDLARRTLGRVQVRSTFAGTVTRVWRGSGALVDGTAATPIVQLAASEIAEFDADATERQLLGITAGQPARVALATGGDEVAGTVRARSTALDPTTGLGLVRIAVESGASTTLGAFGKVNVTTGTLEGLIVPSSAIRGAVSDGAELVVCRGDQAEVRAIRVGWRDDTRVQVASGLAEGERFAVDHVLGLSTGTPIAEVK